MNILKTIMRFSKHVSNVLVNRSPNAPELPSSVKEGSHHYENLTSVFTDAENPNSQNSQTEEMIKIKFCTIKFEHHSQGII